MWVKSEYLNLFPLQHPHYIIIGAGSAGCVLANRLTEDPAVQVLVLEAGGPDRHPYIHIPGAYAKLFRTKVDWAYWSEPQSELHQRRLYLPRGKALGGSSSTNAMAYVRGNRADYDDWAALGNTGWSYQDVLPYFKHAEDSSSISGLDPAYRGSGGPLHVSSAQYQTPYSGAFLEACAGVGIPRTTDYNGAHQTGSSRFQFTIKNGKRHSTAAAYLVPALSRPNLRVMTGAAVQNIILEKDQAVGVRVRHRGQTTELRAQREVLLCAGSFGSPQLLQLSGIGERSALAQHGIATKKELPGVGQNLQDHLFYAVSATSPVRAGLNHLIKPWPQLLTTLQWLFNKKGAFTIGPLEACAFFNADEMGARVDTEFHFAPLHIGKGYDYDMYNLATFPTDIDGFTILPSLLRPASRGQVSLRSNNPADAPLVQPNFLSAEADLLHLIKAGRKALEVLEHPAFAPLRKEVIAPLDSSSDAAWAEHIRRSVETIYHPVGTCKMGHDEMAVVDDQLRVHGIGGLRVVDGSVMPTIVSGNTNAPIIMIAEKAAAMISGR